MVTEGYNPVAREIHVEVVMLAPEPGKVIGETFYEQIQLLQEMNKVSEILRREAQAPLMKDQRHEVLLQT